jgi:small subunit ribosomal protein S16
LEDNTQEIIKGERERAIMVKIRLRRIGARSKPAYRIVVTDSRSPRDGKFIEVIGHYNPLTDPETFDINKEKATKWLATGAKTTVTVERLLAKAGIIEKKERVYAKKAEVDTSKKSEVKETGKETTQ